MSAINARVVLRSHALSNNAAGNAFCYDEALMTKGLKGRMRASTIRQDGAFATSGHCARAMADGKTILPHPAKADRSQQQKSGSWDFRFIGRTDGRD